MSHAAKPSAQTLPRPVERIAGRSGYRPTRHPAPIDLQLAGNEGAQPPRLLLEDLLAAPISMLRQYPDATTLERAIAEQLGCSAKSVIVTAGADEAIDRVCRAYLEPGREMLLPIPSFEMFDRYAELAGASVRTVDWPTGTLPINAMCAAITPATAVIVVVSPNNPTGAVASAEDLARLSAAAPQALLLVDLAYTEFADHDLTASALPLRNAVLCRSLSKAYGLAGLRVGYAIAVPEIIETLRAAGSPFSVAGPSLALALAACTDRTETMRDYVLAVRDERLRLAICAKQLGLDTRTSQGNFVLLDTPDPIWLRDGLASLGIGVRVFPGRPLLEHTVRVSCPGDPSSMVRLEHALASVAQPEALLFDMDGVLADVSGSYRRAITVTAASFGVTVSEADIAAAKARGHANDDWQLTLDLVLAGGVTVTLAEVTERFEALYQGSDQQPGLWRQERLLPRHEVLQRLASRLPLAIVTGRPRADMLRFVTDQGCADWFSVMVCREDGPLKPDPAPARTALERLGVTRAWMIGDTPDDLATARAAGVVALAVVAPGEDRETATATLLHAGAARVLADLSELEEILR